MKREFIPSGFKRAACIGRGEALRLQSNDGTVLSIAVLDHDVIRIRHTPTVPDERLQQSSHAVTSAVTQPRNAPTEGLNASNISGVSRYNGDIEGRYPCPPSSVTESTPTTFEITTETLKLSVALSSDGVPAISYFSRAHSDPFLEELPHRAHTILSSKHSPGGFRHFLKRRDDGRDLHYGLGERASPLTLNGRRFRLETMDALGYNPETTDPLYKLIPFHVTMDTETRVAHGIFYDSFAEGFADFGQEIDAFWGPYRSHTVLQGPCLDMYLFHGPSIASVVSHYTLLTGRPHLPPRYALGYLASAMGYAESENAQELIAALPEQCRKWGVGCDLLHLSSGYTVDEETGARNVFTWNKKRFPEPKKLIADLRKEGIRVSANVKPWLLAQHPNYQQVYDTDGFIKNADTGKPRSTRLWSAGNGATSTGSYFDLSSDAGRAFWKNGVTSLLEMGIESIWNDNNEFSLPDDTDTYAHANDGHKSTTVGAAGRGLQTHLMASASYEAMTLFNSQRRAFLITRSFVSGVQRFASQSWSGDNYTSWHTLKHNIPMGLNAGLGGCVGYGHDVGGFVGPRPSPELFVRWIQNGIWMPRFCVHSWKDEGVTELWMYPEVFDAIRSAVHLRYKLIPYLYTCHYEASRLGIPVIRPLVLEFQHDERVQSASFEFMLGDALLVASVFEEGARSRNLYLPTVSAGVGNEGWWCHIWSGHWFKGGEEVTVGCELDVPGAVFAKSGAIVGLGPVLDYVGKKGGDYERVFWLFPPPTQSVHSGAVFEAFSVDDDGETVNGPVSHLRVKMRASGETVQVCIWREGAYAVEYKHVWVVLPVGDARQVQFGLGQDFSVPGTNAATRTEADGRTAYGLAL
ncbi:hypothetical protein CcCBS67573_g05333 [Chytriomyces confervae]|uniref:Uncharacterized protein n=1 Tax=Chytriomyces confervae TaxID=246404 RepID=A0A507FDN7_9FUNG|nr:hypothetical protein HDU80_000765 [Chytriomyces hyalinus]TPX73396.1 hypothetical protein CcCBS67573_g05333 [Chytriomyces confervae]